MSHPFKTDKCNGCGRTIVWAVSKETGKPIPLDPKPAVYMVWENEHGVAFCERQQEICVEEGNALTMITHFATCPDASKFSRSKKMVRPDA